MSRENEHKGSGRSKRPAGPARERREKAPARDRDSGTGAPGKGGQRRSSSAGTGQQRRSVSGNHPARPASAVTAGHAAVQTSGAPGAQEPVRLNKALAAAGICSRRAADDLIVQGAVSVNGSVVTTPGVKVTVGKDAVAVNGVGVTLDVSRTTFTYVVINKPVRVVTTVNDPQGRTTVLDLLPQEMKNARLFPVGRLDFFSEGLLLLTDDGELTYRLTHPKWHLPKVYRVRVRGKVADTALRTMRSGMTLSEGEELAPVKVNVLREERGVTTLELHLIQGVNRQIRRMCRDLDLTILSLKRFRHGPIDLGNLDRGAARFLDHSEIALLRRATGLE